MRKINCGFTQENDHLILIYLCFRPREAHTAVSVFTTLRRLDEAAVAAALIQSNYLLPRQGDRYEGFCHGPGHSDVAGPYASRPHPWLGGQQLLHQRRLHLQQQQQQQATTPPPTRPPPWETCVVLYGHHSVAIKWQPS